MLPHPAFIEREAIDLTVMATHGRSGPARLLFGSIAEEVLRPGNRPVLVVHGDDDDRAEEQRSASVG